MTAQDPWSDFEAQALTQTRMQCKTGIFLSKLPPEGRERVEKVLANRQVSGAWIIRALKERGIQGTPSASALQRHRSNACTCEGTV